MFLNHRIAPIATGIFVSVVLNLATVLPVFADNYGYDQGGGNGRLLPIVLIALVIAVGIAGLIYWRHRRSGTPES